MNNFIDITFFGYKIGSLSNGKREKILMWPLPKKYILKISGRHFEIEELKYKLVETEDDIFYEMDFEWLLKRLNRKVG
jgi:hypothetical protein